MDFLPKASIKPRRSEAFAKDLQRKRYTLKLEPQPQVDLT